MLTLAFLAITLAQPAPLGPGDHTRTLMMGEQKRTYLVHIPKDYDPNKPAPVVLALHGAAMNGSMMVWFTGLNKTSDKEGFIVVYPSGTGAGPFLTWNAGGFSNIRKISSRFPPVVAGVTVFRDPGGSRAIRTVLRGPEYRTP